MKAYGTKRKDRGCCPGHDKHPKGTYKNRRSKKAHTRDKQVAHGKARSAGHQEINRAQKKTGI